MHKRSNSPMYFFFRPLVYLLLDPLFYTVLLAGLIWFFKKRGKHKLFRTAGAFLLFWFFAVTVSPLAVWLTRKTERTYSEFTEFSTVNQNHNKPFIMVLGAGYTPDPALNPTNQIGESVSLRLMEAIRIYRRLPGCTLITSGVYSKTDSLSQGLGVARAAVALGVSPADTAVLHHTENTEQEARDFVRRFGKKEVIVVTTALHMPRAIKWFQHFGADPIPAPMGYKIKNDPHEADSGWGFSFSKFKLLKSWIKEKAGILYARLKS